MFEIAGGVALGVIVVLVLLALVERWIENHPG